MIIANPIKIITLGDKNLCEPICFSFSPLPRTIKRQPNPIRNSLSIKLVKKYESINPAQQFNNRSIYSILVKALGVLHLTVLIASLDELVER